ncbi:hypothetical protein MY11210_006821 [Beauveria gryllotalpidicola]
MARNGTGYSAITLAAEARSGSLSPIESMASRARIEAEVAGGCRSAGGFQYDYGKKIQDQPFHNTGFLAPPPPILLIAITALLRILTVYTDLMLSIYKAESRLRSCGRNAQSVSIRTARDEDPAIHYGLIASTNQLMKDAKLRDQYANEKGLLCFEMEAAGIINHFPCLISRGICDYAESHKDKEWQGYAAMTAAAYAKDLPNRISLKKVEAEKKLIELVENISEAVRTTSEFVTRIESTAVKDEDDKILNWLTPTSIDYGSQYSDLLKVRQPGTGQWVLDSAQVDSLHQNGIGVSGGQRPLSSEFHSIVVAVSVILGVPDILRWVASRKIVVSWLVC